MIKLWILNGQPQGVRNISIAFALTIGLQILDLTNQIAYLERIEESDDGMDQLMADDSESQESSDGDD